MNRIFLLTSIFLFSTLAMAIDCNNVGGSNRLDYPLEHSSSDDIAKNLLCASDKKFSDRESLCECNKKGPHLSSSDQYIKKMFSGVGDLLRNKLHDLVSHIASIEGNVNLDLYSDKLGSCNLDYLTQIKCEDGHAPNHEILGKTLAELKMEFQDVFLDILAPAKLRRALPNGNPDKYDRINRNACLTKKEIINLLSERNSASNSFDTEVRDLLFKDAKNTVPALALLEEIIKNNNGALSPREILENYNDPDKKKERTIKNFLRLADKNHLINLMLQSTSSVDLFLKRSQEYYIDKEPAQKFIDLWDNNSKSSLVENLARKCTNTFAIFQKTLCNRELAKDVTKSPSYFRNFIMPSVDDLEYSRETEENFSSFYCRGFPEDLHEPINSFDSSVDDLLKETSKKYKVRTEKLVRTEGENFSKMQNDNKDLCPLVLVSPSPPAECTENCDRKDWSVAWDENCKNKSPPHELCENDVFKKLVEFEERKKAVNPVQTLAVGGSSGGASSAPEVSVGGASGSGPRGPGTPSAGVRRNADEDTEGMSTLAKRFYGTSVESAATSDKAKVEQRLGLSLPVPTPAPAATNTVTGQTAPTANTPVATGASTTYVAGPNSPSAASPSLGRETSAPISTADGESGRASATRRAATSRTRTPAADSVIPATGPNLSNNNQVEVPGPSTAGNLRNENNRTLRLPAENQLAQTTVAAPASSSAQLTVDSTDTEARDFSERNFTISSGGNTPRERETPTPTEAFDRKLGVYGPVRRAQLNETPVPTATAATAEEDGQSNAESETSEDAENKLATDAIEGAPAAGAAGGEAVASAEAGGGSASGVASGEVASGDSRRSPASSGAVTKVGQTPVQRRVDVVLSAQDLNTNAAGDVVMSRIREQRGVTSFNLVVRVAGQNGAPASEYSYVVLKDNEKSYRIKDDTQTDESGRFMSTVVDHINRRKTITIRPYSGVGEVLKITP